jgi:Integral peroxisomal membrane peroxin
VETQRTSTHASLASTLREIDILRTRFTLFLTPPSLLIPHLVLPDSQPLLLRLCLAWPIWLLITHKILPPEKIMLVLGTSVLSWSAPWARITCIALWRSRTVRTAAEYILGQDLLTKDEQGNTAPVAIEPPISNTTATTSVVTPERPVRQERQERDKRASTSSITNAFGGGIKITQTLYQSQRRWIGIGWTSNLFPNERSAW